MRPGSQCDFDNVGFADADASTWVREAEFPSVEPSLVHFLMGTVVHQVNPTEPECQEYSAKFFSISPLLHGLDIANLSLAAYRGPWCCTLDEYRE